MKPLDSLLLIKMYKYLFLLLFLPGLVLGESCIKPTWIHIESHSAEYKSIYLTEELPGIVDIMCILGSDFLNTIYSFPTKALLAIINQDTRNGYIIKWSLDTNTFIIIKFNYKEGFANIYSDPLVRIADIFTNKSLPSFDEKVLGKQAVKTTTVSIPPTFIKDLIGE